MRALFRKYVLLVTLANVVALISTCSGFVFNYVENNYDGKLAIVLLALGSYVVAFFLGLYLSGFRPSEIKVDTAPRDFYTPHTPGASTVLEESRIRLQLQFQQFDALDAKLQAYLSFGMTLVALFFAVLALDDTQGQTVPIVIAETSLGALAVVIVAATLIASRVATLTGGPDPVSLAAYSRRNQLSDQQVLLDTTRLNDGAFVENAFKIQRKTRLVKVAQDATALLAGTSVAGLAIVAIF